MSKIKVLYVHHGGASGGAPRSLLFLIEKLDLSRYEPYVVISYDEKELRNLYETAGAKVIYEPKCGAWHGSTVGRMSAGMLYANLKFAYPTYKVAKKVVEQISPDIIHLNSTCLFIFAKAAKKYRPNIPIVCHVREPLLPNFWGDILRRGCRKYTDAFVAIEKYDLDSIGALNKPAKVVYNFVNFDVYNNANKSTKLRNELNLSESDVLALYLARISPENGALEFVKQTYEFFVNNPNVHLCLVGMSSNKSEYEKKVESIVNKISNIHICGFRSDVVELLASSDFLVSPFQQPHFARSVIEAAAMGIPSIGTDIGGLNELIEDEITGLLYKQEDSKDCLRKLERIALDSEFRKKCGLAAEKFARQNFDADKNARATFEIYDELLKEKQGLG